MVYGLVGLNIHAIRQRIQKLRTQLSSDVETTRIDAQDAELSELMQVIGGQSLFATANFIIMSNLSKNKVAREKLDELVKVVGEESTLILVETEIDKRTSYYKQLKKLTTFEEYDELKPGMAAEFIKTYVDQRNGSISSSDAMYLVSLLGVDQSLLANELDKLLLYNPQITKDSIDALTVPSFQDTVFQLIDALSAGKGRHAHELYQGLRKQQIHPLEIMGTISWQLHNLIQIKSAGNQPPYMIARSVGMAPFVVEKNLPTVGRLTIADLKKLVDLALQADLSLKTQGLEPDEVLETFMLEMVAVTTS